MNSSRFKHNMLFLVAYAMCLSIPFLILSVCSRQRLEPLLTAWTSKRPSLVVCDRWCYACLDAAELLDLPLVVYNTGLLNHLEDISTFAHPSSLRVKEESDAQVAKVRVQTYRPFFC